MKEQIHFVITDLNNYKLTIKQLLTLLEKVMFYYSEKNMEIFVELVENFTAYFAFIYKYLHKKM